MHCLDHVMHQFGFKQHILSDINTSNKLHSISYSGRHTNYNWMIYHLQHVSMWDVWRNFIFR